MFIVPQLIFAPHNRPLILLISNCFSIGMFTVLEVDPPSKDGGRPLSSLEGWGHLLEQESKFHHGIKQLPSQVLSAI